jgi:hypothetical protein
MRAPYSRLKSEKYFIDDKKPLPYTMLILNYLKNHFES